MSSTSEKPEQDAIVEEYSRLAATYDSRWSFYVQATARETVSRLPVQPGTRILDVGCGTGALLSRLNELYSQAGLAGIDPVPKMLEIARGRLPGDAELREGWADRLPFDDASFDVVVSNSMFHYIPQPGPALREMRRVLRTGGTLVITDWCDDFLACRICDWYLRWSNLAHRGIYGEQDCRLLLEQVELHDVQIERYRISWLWGLMTARAMK